MKLVEKSSTNEMFQVLKMPLPSFHTFHYNEAATFTQRYEPHYINFLEIVEI